MRPSIVKINEVSMTQMNRLTTFFTIIAALAVFSCSGETDKQDAKRETPQKKVAGVAVQEEFHGWESLTLMNSITRLDIVPELGGKIMGYSIHGYQLLWHDPVNEGLVDTDQGYGFGEHFFNPGGAKVWPAPQGWSGAGQWPGPPDNVIDSAVYEADYDEEAIIVTSPADSAPGRSGLQFTHRYSLVNNSSLVDLHLTMKNVVDHPVTWSLWHLATMPVDRDCSIIVPTTDNGWRVMFGSEDNPAWKGVENGFFNAKYEKQVGKVGISTTDGWAAWRDNETNMTFVMMFPLNKNKKYPDNGSIVEIWANGGGTYESNHQTFNPEYSPETAFMELEVLGPLTKLAPGESASMDVRWGVCRCSDVIDVNDAGVVIEKPYLDGTGIHGKFSTFYRGELWASYMRNDGKRMSYYKIMGVTPFNEITLQIPYDDITTWKADKILFQVRDENDEHITIAEVALK